MTDLPTLRIAPEYKCWPTWVDDAEGLSNPAPEELGLSANLAAELVDWSDEFDSTYDEDDPAAAAFDSAARAESFWDHGTELARRTAQEARGRYTVTYRDPREGQDVAISDDSPGLS